MKQTTAMDKELRNFRAERVMRALQAGRIGPGANVKAWQTRKQLEADFADVKTLSVEANAESRFWTYWGNEDRGGWSFTDSNSVSCKLKQVEFDGPVARSWEVLDQGDALLLAQSLYVEGMGSCTLWRLPASYWPEWTPQHIQNSKAI